MVMLVGTRGGVLNNMLRVQQHDIWENHNEIWNMHQRTLLFSLQLNWGDFTHSVMISIVSGAHVRLAHALLHPDASRTNPGTNANP